MGPFYSHIHASMLQKGPVELLLYHPASPSFFSAVCDSGHCRVDVSASKMSAAKRLIPLLDRVLVKRLEPPTKSIGGVLLPESTQARPRAARPPTPRARAMHTAGRAVP